MKILYRCTAVLLSLALVLTSMPSEALALRPIAYKAEIDAAADYDEEEEVEPDDETLPD